MTPDHAHLWIGRRSGLIGSIPFLCAIAFIHHHVIIECIELMTIVLMVLGGTCR